MFYDDIFSRFCLERNIKDGTVNGYSSALNDYAAFHEESIDELINEAMRQEEEKIPLRKRKIKERILGYRTNLLKSGKSQNTVKTYMSKIISFYKHFEIEIPRLPPAKYDVAYESSFYDLPTKKHIKEAVEISDLDMKAIILFMSSSGTAKAETLSLRVRDFVEATSNYHSGGKVVCILEKLAQRNDVIPTFYLKRHKTNKFYYTFCSPEATKAIVRYLKTRKNLTLDDKLFKMSDSRLMNNFQKINDTMEWGWVGNYRFFRSHTLRKFHASNIGLETEYIDEIQGRSKNEVHSAYIKPNPTALKDKYKKAMKNILVYAGDEEDRNVTQEFTIVVNIFLSGQELNIM